MKIKTLSFYKFSFFSSQGLFFLIECKKNKKDNAIFEGRVILWHINLILQEVMQF